jgi:ribosome-binding factor A
MMDHRSERISETLREELGELIGYEMSDPRVSTVYVTAVHISPNKRFAVVRIGVGEGADGPAALAALEKAKSFLLLELASRVELFRLPDLRFEIDPAAALGGRLEHLMKRIRKGRPRDDEKKAVE